MTLDEQYGPAKDDVPDYVVEAGIAFFKFCPECGAERTKCSLQYWEAGRLKGSKVEHWSCKVCGKFFRKEIEPT